MTRKHNPLLLRKSRFGATALPRNAAQPGMARRGTLTENERLVHCRLKIRNKLLFKTRAKEIRPCGDTSAARLR